MTMGKVKAVHPALFFRGFRSTISEAADCHVPSSSASNHRHTDRDLRTVLCRSVALAMEIQSAFFVRLKASRRVRIGTAFGCAGVSDKRSFTD
jgi:hypothetical protein